MHIFGVLTWFLGGQRSIPLLPGLASKLNVSLANTTAELYWILALLTELSVPVGTPTVYCDNFSTVVVAHSLVLHSRTKHMELTCLLHI